MTLVQYVVGIKKKLQFMIFKTTECICKENICFFIY